MDATVARLRKLAFGPSADRRAPRSSSGDVVGMAAERAVDEAASVPDSAASTSVDDSTSAQTGGEPQERTRRKGHGRKPAVFEEASRLPRRQQQKIAEFVSAFVRQYEQTRQR